MLNSLAFGLVDPSISILKKSEEEVLDLGIGQPLLSKLPNDIYQSFSHISGINQYYPASGDQRLRELILDKYYPELGTQNIAITNGAIGALDFVFRSYTNSKSSVLLPNPGFPPYEKLARISGHTVQKYEIDALGKSLINWESVNKTLNHETKLLLINSPHNPTGKVFTEDDFQELSRILNSYPKLNLIIDEVYRDLIYDGLKHLDFTSVLERAYIIGSFSKVFPIQGARIGWVVTSYKKQKRLEPYFQNAYGSVSSYGQELAKIILKRKLDYFALYDESRTKILKELDKLDFSYIYPMGTFYIFLSTPKGIKKLAKKLEARNISVIDGLDFGTLGEGFIRISFAQDFKIIKKALLRIKVLYESY